MRATGVLLIVILLALAIVLLLRSHEAARSEEAVVRVSGRLREAGVDGEAFDREAASRAVTTLTAVARGERDATADELAAIAARAARWAEGAPTPSAELTAAVAIRTAADELRQFALNGGETHRSAARRQLMRARDALAGGGSTRGGGSVQGVRDRLQNLQQSEREHIQELDEALGQ